MKHIDELLDEIIKNYDEETYKYDRLTGRTLQSLDSELPRKLSRK